MHETKRNSVPCAILADRNAPLADRLRQLLATVSGSVFLVADPRSLLDGARRLDPALLILDLGFTEDGGMKLLQQLRSEVPQAWVIVLSLYDDPTIAKEALLDGASGVVLKRAIGEDLLQAVETVLAGGTYISPSFQAHDLA